MGAEVVVEMVVVVRGVGSGGGGGRADALAEWGQPQQCWRRLSAGGAAEQPHHTGQSGYTRPIRVHPADQGTPGQSGHSCQQKTNMTLVISQTKHIE